MYKENLTTNIMHSTEDIGNAFRKILERLNNKNNETIEVHHICSTCKHRCSETYITQDWGVNRHGIIGAVLIKNIWEQNLVKGIINIFQNLATIGKFLIISKKKQLNKFQCNQLFIKSKN